MTKQMNRVLSLYKKPGETPLQALDRLRIEDSSLVNEKLSYAGRLDPLASGVMLVLVGEANFEREKFLGLDKVYRVKILFGASTDTGDVMGLVLNLKSSDQIFLQDFSVIDLQNHFEKFVGVFEQKYPKYSSKTVEGIQLHAHARAGNNIEVPTHKVEIKSIEMLGVEQISGNDLLAQIREKISAVTGDFRQKEIIEKWEQEFKLDHSFTIISLRISSGSGFYVRQFAEDLGADFYTPALAFEIIREKVGDFN